MADVSLHLGDCLSVMRDMDADSIDAICADPPAGINFMSAKWDGDKGGRKQWIAWMTEVAAECLRLIRPGGHALVWALPRTSHWTATAWEDAGFEIRDCVYHIFGSGFPKSHNVSVAIDKHFEAERELVERIRPDGKGAGQTCSGFVGGSQSPRLKRDDVAATDAARQWDGFGTALKPSVECWWLLRKPLSEPTIAANVLLHGTGAINVDGCRIPTTDDLNGGGYSGGTPKTMFSGLGRLQPEQYVHPQGRWPANLLLSDDAAALLDEMSGTLTSGKPNGAKRNVGGSTFLEYANGAELTGYGDTGGASRYFARFAPDADDEPLRMYYCGKASRRDRDEGLEGMPERAGALRENGRFHSGGRTQVDGEWVETGSAPLPKRNSHPTVKPTALCRWLVRLVTPPGGTVLDPFLGSGSTLKAAVLEGFNGIGIELDEEYLAIARARIEHARQQVAQMSLELS